ncbi:Hypothetical protein CINCED_3A005604 [Cinara cedri]|uniref:DUF4371 domain-containing protein n=1 Tax=Cinara cedri TaxID=506608 RepID=A0A5E4MQX2_9HEMI|nr:Hypothetical protein CINCED_3A005604 [Cinara cedri]
MNEISDLHPVLSTNLSIQKQYHYSRTTIEITGYDPCDLIVAIECNYSFGIGRVRLLPRENDETFQQYFHSPTKKEGQNKITTLEASYLLALRVARKSKPHTINTNLILPAAIDMVNIMIGPEEILDTISRRINEMETDANNQIVQNLKSSEYFSIQFDESTDVTNLAQFVCFVRYECDGTIKENMFFCKSIPGYATGQGLFELFIGTTKN